MVINNSVPSTSAFWVGCYNNTSVISGIRGDGLGSGGIYTTSDRRLKQNISDFTNTLDIISRLQPRQYEYKTAGIRTYGFIAQELNEVFPTAVVGSPDGDVTTDPMMVDYGKLTPLLTGGIKELHELVKKQSSDIEALKRQLEEQKALIDALLKK